MINTILHKYQFHLFTDWKEEGNQIERGIANVKGIPANRAPFANTKIRTGM